MNIKIYLSAAVMALVGLSSCSDFLEQENSYQASEDGFFTSDESIRQATSPLYNYVWNDFNGKFYYSVGDGRSNNLTARWSDYIYPYTNFTENSLSPGLEDAWGSFYSVVAQSNYVIADIEKKCGEGVSEEAKIQGHMAFVKCVRSKFLPIGPNFFKYLSFIPIILALLHKLFFKNKHFVNLLFTHCLS